MLVITDADDTSYDGVTWPPGVRACVQERLPVLPKVNRQAMNAVARHKALFFVGDDCVFRTLGWDEIMLRELDAMGGTGILYPDDKRRTDIPEHYFVSADIIGALGWFSWPDPAMNMYYIDNIWADIGRRAGCLKLVPEAVIEHRHYSVCEDVPYDEIYQSGEAWGPGDAQAYQAWRRDRMTADVTTVKALLAAKGAGYKLTIRGANGIAGHGADAGTPGAVREAAEVLQGNH